MSNELGLRNVAFEVDDLQAVVDRPRTATDWSAASASTSTPGAWPTCADRRGSSCPSPSASADAAVDARSAGRQATGCSCCPHGDPYSVSRTGSQAKTRPEAVNLVRPIAATSPGESVDHDDRAAARHPDILVEHLNVADCGEWHLTRLSRRAGQEPASCCPPPDGSADGPSRIGPAQVSAKPAVGERPSLVPGSQPRVATGLW